MVNPVTGRNFKSGDSLQVQSYNENTGERKDEAWRT